MFGCNWFSLRHPQRMMRILCLDTISDAFMKYTDFQDSSPVMF
jgi:hypothetical protein